MSDPFSISTKTSTKCDHFTSKLFLLLYLNKVSPVYIIQFIDNKTPDLSR